MRTTTTIPMIAGLFLFVSAVPGTSRGAQSERPPYQSAQPRATLRLKVTPQKTQVYVDGYYSGIAEDFEGHSDRLPVSAGEHEIVLYLKGYRTVRQSLNLRPGRDYTVEQKMEKLPAGESSEPPPAPSKPAEGPNEPGSFVPPPPPSPYERPRPSDRPPVGREPSEAPQFGTVAIRVQPTGADVIVDGDRWQGPEGQEPLVLQLAVGMHHVEVRKEGYQSFSTDVRIREGETSQLNISLPERR